MSSGGVMLSGWLRKSPPERKLRSRHHSWKKRWFVLKSGRLSGDPNVLEYSKYQTSKKPIKIINLNDCKQIDSNVSIAVKGDKKDTSEHFVFSIVTSPRTFYLVTDSYREMSTWVQCLCDLCGFNHDTNDKDDMGRREQTFRSAQPTNLNVNGAGAASSTTLLPSAIEVPPAPMSRPDKTHAATAVSTTVIRSDVRNGTVNSSFTHNGYDGEEVRSKAAPGITVQHNTREHDFHHESQDVVLMHPDLPALTSMDDADNSGYLRLTECESVPNEQDCVFLSVDKTDARRCSTDSVFTHGDGTDDSKDDDGLLAPMIQSKSRFLDPTNARLDSMPSVPPPPPPTDVPPHPRFGDDDDDDVVDARSKRTHSSRSGRLPPIDDSTALYKVPPGLQRAYRFNDETTVWQGSNSSSSYGSGPGGDERYSGKLLSPPDYINTPDGKSTAGRPSGSSFSSSSPSSANSVNHGHQIYDIPSPMSPVFPLSASPRPSYQVPQSLERSIITRNASMSIHKSENLVRNELKDVKMLDVSQLPVSQNEATYSTASEIEKAAPDQNTDSTYDVPPVRPPKPTSTPKGQMQTAEGLYSSPRNLSATGNDQGTYDTVRHPVPLSPPHSTVIGVIPNYPNTLKSGPLPQSSTDRNAISATNSPLATPDLSRRSNVSRATSPKSSSSLLAAQNKGVFGSAPTIYDVPQALSKSPAHMSMREARASCNSDGGGVRNNSDRNSATDASAIYDMLRKSSDTSVLTKLELDKVDDMMHPSYEKMAAQPNFISDIQDDSYTAMAGALSTPDMRSFTSQHPPTHSALSKPIADHPPLNMPPPVHRDLKPGRRSLGSDGGSSQSGFERRNNNSRDSYGSDEAVSPPHTTVVHTIPIGSDPKSFLYGHNNTAPIGSRGESMTSPQRSKIGGIDFHSQMNTSSAPPRRPPKSVPLPRSPPSATSPNQLPDRPYTPPHGSHKSPLMEQSASPSPPFSAVPKRPPKPANMRYTHISMHSDESRPPSRRHPKPNEDPGFVPSRPPKPSMTPSTGDSLHSGSSLPSSFFPHSASSYGPSSIVPPPPVEHIERELKYIEISPPNPAPLNASDSVQDRNASVEYTWLDADRTRALEISKKERQSKMQRRANFDTQSIGRGKD